MTAAGRRAGFEAAIVRGESIEPGDWMPEGYRATVVRQIARHAHHFTRSARVEAEWITRAPTLLHRATLFARVQSRAAHALHLAATAETLGVDGRELTRRQQDASILGHRPRGFADVCVIGWLVDGAALCLLAPLRRSSYGPLARAAVLVCRGESFHRRQVYELLLAMTRGSVRQRAVVQAAVDRWWWPALWMAGPPGVGEPRRSFVARTAPQAERLGVRLYDRQPYPVDGKEASTG